MVGIHLGNAQNTELFRFVSEQTNAEGKHLVLHHNLTTNKAEAVAISTEELNAKDGYLQAFIIKPIEGSGRVLIASAKDQRYFLKSTNDSETPPSINENHEVDFSTIPEGEKDLIPYLWNIQFAGEYLNGSMGTVLQVYKEGGDNNEGLSVSREGKVYTNLMIDKKGNDRRNGSGDFNTKHLIRLQKISNVF